MLIPRTIDETLRGLMRPDIKPLRAPVYQPPPETNTEGTYQSRAMFAVSSMAQHMTDEGWQIAQSLASTGYSIVGHGCPGNVCNTTDVLSYCLKTHPKIVVMQDKREWDLAGPHDFRDREARFQHVDWLATQPQIFKLTILKDSHQRPAYHAQSAQEMEVHGWIIYYHPRIVKHLAPYTRKDHYVRTYHTINPDHVPPFNFGARDGAILSGAVSSAYPLRGRIRSNATALAGLHVLAHPGYHRHGCATPAYLETLSRYKVAICTSSMYGYALRKIIEATVAGCRVLTDLPTDEVMPAIDENLERVHPNESIGNIDRILRKMQDSYDPDRQHALAQSALSYYAYPQMGIRLARDIESLRGTYEPRSIPLRTDPASALRQPG